MGNIISPECQLYRLIMTDLVAFLGSFRN